MNVPSFKAKPMPTSVRSRKDTITLKKREVTKPKSPLLGLKRRADNKKGVLRDQSQQMIPKRDPHLRKRHGSKSSPSDLIGLGILSETKKVKDRENIPPSQPSHGSCHLYTATRAKDRADFNAAFILRERERHKQRRKDVGLLITKKLQELEVMKQSLR